MMNTHKEHTHAPRGGFGRLLAVSAFGASLALPLSAQSTLDVDLGRDDSTDPQDVESGFTDWSIVADNVGDTTPWNTSRVFSVDWGNGGAFNPGANEVRLFIADSLGSGGNLDARNRADVSGTPGDLVEDLWFADGSIFSDLIFTFQGIEAGTFEMELFANDTEFAGGQQFDIDLDDANGSSSPGTITDNLADSFDSLVFNFTSNGTDDVVVTLNGAGVSGGNGRSNGFTIAVPEPGSFALIGGLLALGSVMLRRRVRG